MADDYMLKLLCHTLGGTTRDCSFDLLYSRLARDWQHRDDIATAFTDRRWKHVGAVWTLILDDDILRLEKEDRSVWAPLELVRQRLIRSADFKPYNQPPLPTSITRSVSRANYCKMRRKDLDATCLQRRKAFVSRILADFASQWRHVLCGRYNDFTFRRLAWAIIRIVTLNFNVKEITMARQGIGGFLVWIDDLPNWNYSQEHVIRIGQTPIVMSQHAPHAIALVHQDFAKHVQYSPASGRVHLTYLIVSVRELYLYIMSNEVEEYSEPIRLFDGTNDAPEEAVDLLLQATHTTAATVSNLHHLPLELQNKILEGVAAGPIESARMGCLLDIGSVFDWRHKQRDIAREEGRRSRTPWSPVESQIYFENHPSGVAYK